MDKYKSKVISTLLFQKRSPSLRDHPLHSAKLWLDGKRIDDNIGDFWRIHDVLYDFSPFVHSHPGGSEWLEMTRGTDITEAFEVHHISLHPESLLDGFEVCKATTKRNSPFTFEENGFYRTLKRRVRAVLEDLPSDKRYKSNLYMDCLFGAFLLLSLASSVLRQWWLTLPAGLLLSMSTICAHNYFHRRDNWRMYYFDFSLMSSRAWRVTHALSHHIYTNTVYDYEISVLEPFIQYLPIGKPKGLKRYLSILILPEVFAFAFAVQYLQSLLQVLADGWQTFRKELLIPFIVPVLMYSVSNMNLLHTIALWLTIVTIGSIHFMIVGVTAGHHHPNIFHDGDELINASLDWGEYQLHSVAEKPDTKWSQFLVLTTFGDHVLHHLFPTLDHGDLPFLEPFLLEVCEEFNSKIMVLNSLSLFKGQFEQLTRATTAKGYSMYMNKQA